MEIYKKSDYTNIPVALSHLHIKEYTNILNQNNENIIVLYNSIYKELTYRKSFDEKKDYILTKNNDEKKIIIVLKITVNL